MQTSIYWPNMVYDGQRMVNPHGYNSFWEVSVLIPHWASGLSDAHGILPISEKSSVKQKTDIQKSLLAGNLSCMSDTSTKSISFQGWFYSCKSGWWIVTDSKYTENGKYHNINWVLGVWREYKYWKERDPIGSTQCSTKIIFIFTNKLLKIHKELLM